MKYAVVCVVFAAGSLAMAQTAVPQAATRPGSQPEKSAPIPAGVASEWDVRTLAASLRSGAQRLKPILDQLNPQSWVSKGAPEAYVTQWKETQADITYLSGSADALTREPERLTAALDAYFRLEALNVLLQSLAGGIRRYQNPAAAELLQSVANENTGTRDRLRQYVQDLAAEREQLFQIADREAQRCRGTLLRQAPSNSR